MKKRRIICLIIALMTIVAATAGCTGGEKAKTSSDVKLTGIDEFPVVEEKIEFNVFANKHSMVADYETNEFTKWYEDKTNVHINWTVPSGNAQQSFNLMIVSGEYPDFVLGMGQSREQVMNLVQQGVLVDIKEHIDKYGTNIKKMLEEVPEAKRFALIDGKIYGIPRAREDFDETYSNGMWAYKPWMEKLGIAEPQTTEDFYQMLKAFKEKDPNGNGLADEIPFAARGVGDSGVGVEPFLMNAFVPTNGGHRYYEDNGVIKYAAAQPEYREGLRYIKKLYDEGLIYQDSFIIDRNQLTAIGESETPILGSAAGSYPGFFCNPTATTERYHEFTSIPPLEGPNGVRIALPRSPLGGAAFMVTKECEHPDVAVKWVDWLISPEGTFKSQERGISTIRKAKEGELGVDGQQALWTVEPTSEEVRAKNSGSAQNVGWYLSTIWYWRLEDSLRTYDPITNQTEAYKLYNSYNQYRTDCVPIIYIAPEDVSAYTDYQSIKDETEAAFAKFITGELSIDNDWDKYIEGLNALGLKEYLELLQRNYDAGK